MAETVREICRTLWTKAPVTTVCLVIAAALFLGVRIDRAWNPGEADEALRRWGAAQMRQVVVSLLDLDADKLELQLTGLFDLWNGQLHRIPISSFHHGGVWHLLVNAFSIAYMGFLLEPKLSRRGYAAFIGAASVISILPEFFVEHSAIGLSGVGYAMFGMLLVVRKRDPGVAARFPDAMVVLGMIWFVFCFIATAMEIMNIANLAHTGGLVYGWLAGWALFGTFPVQRTLRGSFYAAHLLLIPALYFVMNPVWNGRYHWYLAVYETDQEKRVEHIRNALARDPSLREPWLYLAVVHRDEGNLRAAWETTLEGLSYNRSFDLGVDMARDLWRRFRTPGQRREAQEMLSQIFDEQADAWRKRIGLPPEGVDLLDVPILVQRRTEPVSTQEERFPLDQRLELPARIDGMEELRQRDLQAPGVDPERPDSASVGVRL